MNRTGSTLLPACLALAFAAACEGPGSLAPVDPLEAPRSEHAVVGAPFMATSTQAGETHACALGVDRTAYCWGSNTVGQLGDGTGASAVRPVAVAGRLGFVKLAVGGAHSCGLSRTGQAHCWGANWHGQLGDGSTENASTPVPVAGGVAFTALTAGLMHTCGLDEGGQAHCWGRNSRGEVGDETTETRSSPVAVAGGRAFQAIDAGLASTCALDGGGEIHCWGWNQHLQLGNGTNVDALTPTPLAGGLRFETLSTGAIQGCALTADGTAYCWGGRGFSFGQLGHGEFTESAEPVAVTGGLRFASISASPANLIFTFTCGVSSGNEAYCWGANFYGQLGTTAPLQTCSANVGQLVDFPCSDTPVPVAGEIAFNQIDAGHGFACGTARQKSYCWGRNSMGQLGNGTLDSASEPVRVLGPGPGARGRQPPGTPAAPQAARILDDWR